MQPQPAQAKDPQTKDAQPDRTSLCLDALARIEHHSKSAVRRNKRYKRMANWSHIAVPLTSLALTILATSSFPHQESVTAGVAIALTVMTGLNSTLEPTRRYREYVNHAIALYDLQYAIEMRRVANPDEPIENLVAFLADVNEKISDIGREMSGLPIPGNQP